MFLLSGSKMFGLTGWELFAGYCTLAIPVVAIMVRSAWERDYPAGGVVGLGSISAFAIAPYAQFYDFPVLLASLFALLGNQRPSGIPARPDARAGRATVSQFSRVGYRRLAPCTFAWVPATLAISWLITAFVSKGSALRGLQCRS